MKMVNGLEVVLDVVLDMRAESRIVHHRCTIFTVPAPANILTSTLVDSKVDVSFDGWFTSSSYWNRSASSSRLPRELSIFRCEAGSGLF